MKNIPQLSRFLDDPADSLRPFPFGMPSISAVIPYVLDGERLQFDLTLRSVLVMRHDGQGEGGNGQKVNEYTSVSAQPNKSIKKNTPPTQSQDIM